MKRYGASPNAAKHLARVALRARHAAYAAAQAPQSAVESALNIPAPHAVHVVAAVETAPLPAPTSATLPAAQGLHCELCATSA